MMAKWYLKEWRKHRGLTQERLADRLETTKGFISQLENGHRGYTQRLLERLADALMCEPADLLIRNPTDPAGVWSIWETVPEVKRPDVLRIMQAMSDSDQQKTGTDN